MNHYYEQELAAIEPSFTKGKVHFIALEENIYQLETLIHDVIIPQLQNASSVKPTISKFNPTPTEYDLPETLLEEWMTNYEGSSVPAVKPTTIPRRSQ